MQQQSKNDTIFTISKTNLPYLIINILDLIISTIRFRMLYSQQNNFIIEWLESWDANMDVQLAFDIFAIITYICEYVTKDFLQQCV